MDRNICDSYEYRRRGSKLHRSENFNYLDHIVNLYITLNSQKNLEFTRSHVHPGVWCCFVTGEFQVRARDRPR